MYTSLFFPFALSCQNTELFISNDLSPCSLLSRWLLQRGLSSHLITGKNTPSTLNSLYLILANVVSTLNIERVCFFSCCWIFPVHCYLSNHMTNCLRAVTLKHLFWYMLPRTWRGSFVNSFRWLFQQYLGVGMPVMGIVLSSCSPLSLTVSGLDEMVPWQEYVTE